MRVRAVLGPLLEVGSILSHFVLEITTLVRSIMAVSTAPPANAALSAEQWFSLKRFGTVPISASCPSMPKEKIDLRLFRGLLKRTR